MAWELHLGHLRVISISDGHMHVDPHQFMPLWDDAAAGSYDKNPDGTIRNEIGCFLVEDGGSLSLVDTGGGPPETAPPHWNETGRLIGELASLGIEPGDIERIIHTHLHRDHWGGDLTAAGVAAFPEAEIVLMDVEIDAWRDDENTAPFMGLVDEGRVAAVGDGVSITPALSVLATPGHTPGHLSVLLDGGPAQAVILGDAAHHPAQLNNPHWNVKFDRDQDLATLTRTRLFERLIANDEILMGGHWPGAGWGRIIVSDDRRSFEPL